MNKIIELINIKKSYGEQLVLKEINFSINRKDIVTIKGKSGSGKSTLLNIIGFIDGYDNGNYYFNLKTVNTREYSKIRNEEIGFVFQNYNLINGLSVIDNIKIPYLYSKVKITDYDKKINYLITFLEIENLLNKNIVDLSGGEKQRVSICRALSLEPKILLADEPTGNLDPANKQIVRDIFKKINDYYGITILIVTHDDTFDSISNKRFRIEDGLIYEEVWIN